MLFHPNKQMPMLTSSHQDIKPGNILIGAQTTPPNKYKISLKLSDFGMSDFWRISERNPDAQGVDKRGDQMYSAPECIVNHEVLQRIENRVGSEVDIWSLGCVFSEAAIWAVCGEKGRHDCLKRRIE